MIGRKVESKWHRLENGEVIKWEPFNHASSCDVLVRTPDGRVCWYHSDDPTLKPIDGLGPLPSRKEACEAADAEALRSLQAIRAQHVRDFAKPWPGAEHGKAIIGMAIDGAIAEVEARLKR